jgi:hypothetical protein
MKKNSNDITELFRSQLEHAELTPREGFWENINNDILPTLKKRRRILLYRISAAASVLLILGSASAAFLYLSSNKDVKQTVAKANIVSKNILNKNINPQESIVAKINPKELACPPKSRINNSSKKRAQKHSNNIQDLSEDNDSTVTVTMHLSISYNERNNYDNNQSNRYNIWQTSTSAEGSSESTDNTVNLLLEKKNSTWSAKAAFNIGLPSKNNFDSPIGGSLTFEKKLSNWLAIESGVLYSYLHSEGQTLHYLGVPVKANATLAQSSDVDLYATAGGIADKCISSNGGSSSEPIQLATFAGLGLRYHLNKLLSLYVEPTMTHYFNNGSDYTSFRTKRKNDLNLQCGLCITY